MSAPELVTLTIDDRQVAVPKGTGLVETALAAGIEIPVFCYEPRLGAPVGACRMCLCEVEGMPKLQAACTMTAQDGMVVRTAQSSARAKEGQEATLEFILVNHPLDCPVCDKGGECPLQDLTFRFGPANTRMRFDKITLEKPIPISPTISLDRERCILCYRCTRFSEGIAEDGQLVARNRGAATVITTFEDEPYRAPFSGNVTELCPVGALLPTQYRFQARPWEIQSVPTVCGLCPVGCNVSVTTREGKAKRVLSRNHPEVDEGWLCDKGRFAFSHLYAGDRILAPLLRRPRAGLAETTWDEALAEVARLLGPARGRTVVALSGSETIEQAYALAKVMRRGLGSHSAVLPEETSPSLDAYRLPLSAIRDAQVVVVVGDEPVVERAPVVDLWLKAAARNGAEVITIGPSGTLPAPLGGAAQVCRDLAQAGNELGERLRTTERVVLVWSGPGGQGGLHLSVLAASLDLGSRAGSGAFLLPATPNGRGVADAWAAAADDDEAGDPTHPIGVLLVSGDEAAADPNVRALAEKAEAVIAITMFHGLAVGWADVVLPGTSSLEREGTMVNLEGRLQRLRRTVLPPVPDELEWLSQLAGRLGVELSPYASRLFAEISDVCYDGIAFADVEEQATLRPRAAAQAQPAPEPVERRTAGGGPIQLLRYRPLFSGPAVERVPELQFQRPAAEIELAHADAAVRGIGNGDLVRVSSNGTSVELRARVSRRLTGGVARVAAEHVAAFERDGVEISKT